MGFFGWGGWLSERIDHYTFLMENTDNKEEKEAYAKIIADLEAKKAEEDAE